MRVAFVCVLVAIVALQVVAKDSCNGKDFGDQGKFDFYTYAQSWSAGWCETSGHSNVPGCVSPTQFQMTNATIHGMWPNYDAQQGNHWWPQCCDSTFGNNVDPNVVKQLLPQLQEYWPNEQDPTGGNLGSSLWAHEWNKHGTCSGLDQTPYFENAMNIAAQLGTPSIITQNRNQTVSIDALYEAYGASNCQNGQPCLVGFSCTNNALVQIMTCWGKDFTQIPCPWETISKSSCKGDVKIISF
jgi:ribonuclease T2